MVEVQAQVEIRPLAPEEWEQLAPVFEAEFGDDALPTPLDSRVVGAFDPDGRLVGFIVVEELLHLAQMHVAEDARGEGVGNLLAAYVEQSIPAGRSAIAVAQTEEGERMCGAWGFREIPGRLYRRTK